MTNRLATPEKLFSEVPNCVRDIIKTLTSGAWHGEMVGSIPETWGRLDQNGYLFILERLKDLIKRSGHSVFPSEVEQALYKHPAVAEAAVFGIAHEALGEEIKAAVVLKPGMMVEAQALIDHCKSLLAAYKYPRMISFHDDLPKNHNGKIMRWALRNGMN